MIHHAFQFRHVQFWSAVTPLVDEVDRGNNMPLYEIANDVIQNTDPDKWRLFGNSRGRP
jgi:hypothetical protein